MSDISIDKKTGISFGLLLVLAPAAFWGISNWTRVQGEVQRNSSDIANILSRLDLLNDNLNTTNQNIIRLNGRLDGMVDKTDVTVAPATNPGTVKVVYADSQSMQPNHAPEQNGIQPMPSANKPEPSQPQEPVTPQEPTLLSSTLNIVTETTSGLLHVLER